MRRAAAAASTCIVLSGAALVQPASAAHDHPIAVVVGGHAGARFEPGPRTQFWRVRVVAPRKRVAVTATVWAAPELAATVTAIDPRLPDGGHFLWFGAKSRSARPGGVRLGGSGALVDLVRTRAGWRLDVRAGEVRAHFRLTNPAPGVRAGPWLVQRQEDRRRGRLYWATPAPSARASVRVTSESGTTRLKGADGYLDRTWGSLDLEQNSWSGWTFAQLVFGPRRAAIVHGVNNPDEIHGPHSADATLRPVVVRVSGGRVRACRGRVDRYGPWPMPHMRARCGGRATWFLIRRRNGLWALGRDTWGLYWCRSTSAIHGRKKRGFGTWDGFSWSSTTC